VETPAAILVATREASDQLHDRADGSATDDDEMTACRLSDGRDACTSEQDE
jgi:hypothetical protein